MWKDFRNFALVFVTVLSVLSFSVYTRNKMDRNSVFYDNLVAVKEKIVQDEIAEINQKKEKAKKDSEILESLKKQQVTISIPKKVNVYVPPIPVVVEPTPVPPPAPAKVIVPKPTRQTRAS